MRSYLKKRGEQVSLRTWMRVIAGAPAPLEKKLSALKHIACCSDHEGQQLAQEYYQAAERALEALHTGTGPSTVFLLVQVSASETGFGDEQENVFLFTSYDAVQAFARTHLIEECYEDGTSGMQVEPWYWYELTPCCPREDGKFYPGEYTYLLSAEGEIWFFDPERESCLRDRAESDFWCSGMDLNLPVPFRPGDVLTVDCRPFRPGLAHCLVLEVGDNWDCCCVQVLYPTFAGRVDVGALKHGHCFPGDACCQLSPLYRVRRCQDELPEREHFLQVLGQKIAARPELSERLWKTVSWFQNMDEARCPLCGLRVKGIPLDALPPLE